MNFKIQIIENTSICENKLVKKMYIEILSITTLLVFYIYS